MGFSIVRGYCSPMRVFSLVCLALGFLSVVSSLQGQDSDARSGGLPDSGVLKASFQSADAALNRVWSDLKTKLGESEFQELKALQRAWLEYRDYMAEWQAGPDVQDKGPGAIRSTPSYLETATHLTEARVEFLQGWVNEPRDLHSWEGEYVDSFGGRLAIVEKNGALQFSLEVVRGATFHTGSISGVAEKNAHLAQYSDKSDDSEKAKEFGETWLHFKRDDRFIVVSGANTGHYHGARAYFNGKYIRIGKARLEDTQRGAVEE